MPSAGGVEKIGFPQWCLERTGGSEQEAEYRKNLFQCKDKAFYHKLEQVALSNVLQLTLLQAETRIRHSPEMPAPPSHGNSETSQLSAQSL